MEFIQRISKRYEYGCVYRLLDIDGDIDIDCNLRLEDRTENFFVGACQASGDATACPEVT